MSDIDFLVEDVKVFKPFSLIQSQLLDFNSTIKAQLLTSEMLLQKLNDLFSSFTDSQFSSIDVFFAESVYSSFGSELRAKAFCFNLLLSFRAHRPASGDLELFWLILTQHTNVEIYEFFYRLRSTAIKMKGLADSSFVNLATLYMSEREWVEMLETNLRFDIDQIQQFETQIKQTLWEEKTGRSQYKLPINYTKNGQFCVVFLLREMLRQYIVFNEEDREKNRKDLAEYKEQLTETFQFRRSKLPSKIHYQIIEDSELTNEPGDSEEAKLKEKERLIAELKNFTRMANQFKTSSAKLLTYIAELDPIYETVKDKVNSGRSNLARIKREKLTELLNAEFNERTPPSQLNFIEKGSNLRTRFYQSIMKELLTQNKASLRTMTERIEDSKPGVKRMVKSLKDKIFSEGFNIHREIKSADKVKEDLVRIFTKFGKLENEDLMILDTIYKNYNSNDNCELQVENVLGVFAEKLSKIATSGISDESVEMLDPKAMQNDLIFARLAQSETDPKPKFTESDVQADEKIVVKTSFSQGKAPVFEKEERTSMKESQNTRSESLVNQQSLRPSQLQTQGIRASQADALTSRISKENNDQGLRMSLNDKQVIPFEQSVSPSKEKESEKTSNAVFSGEPKHSLTKSSKEDQKGSDFDIGGYIDRIGLEAANQIQHKKSFNLPEIGSTEPSVFKSPIPLSLIPAKHLDSVDLSSERKSNVVVPRKSFFDPLDLIEELEQKEKEDKESLRRISEREELESIKRISEPQAPPSAPLSLKPLNKLLKKPDIAEPRLSATSETRLSTTNEPKSSLTQGSRTSVTNEPKISLTPDAQVSTTSDPRISSATGSKKSISSRLSQRVSASNNSNPPQTSLPQITQNSSRKLLTIEDTPMPKKSKASDRNLALQQSLQKMINESLDPSQNPETQTSHKNFDSFSRPSNSQTLAPQQKRKSSTRTSAVAPIEMRDGIPFIPKEALLNSDVGDIRFESEAGEKAEDLNRYSQGDLKKSHLADEEPTLHREASENEAQSPEKRISEKKEELGESEALALSNQPEVDPTEIQEERPKEVEEPGDQEEGLNPEELEEPEEGEEPREGEEALNPEEGEEVEESKEEEPQKPDEPKTKKPFFKMPERAAKKKEFKSIAAATGLSEPSGNKNIKNFFTGMFNRSAKKK